MRFNSRLSAIIAVAATILASVFLVMHPAFAADPVGSTASGAAQNVIAGMVAGKGLPVTMLLIFAAGIGLTFTPCVFPMIPIIVGWFTLQGSGKRGKVGVMAALFVLGLAITYALLGLSASKAGGMLGASLQMPVVIIAIAAVFMTLALSMFGLFELQPPSFISNKSGGKQGYFGVFLMGALFGIIAAPCAGPVVAALLVYVGQLGKPVLGFWMLFTLAMGLGLPFFLLAIFSGALGALPRSGEWMLSVKKIFGVILVYFALKYVRPLMENHSAEYVAIAFFVFAGLYLGILEKSLGKVRILRPVRPVMGIALAALGIWSVISVPKEVTFVPYSSAVVEQAQKDGKPIVLDFSAVWCKPCKELDAKTFSAHEVTKEGGRFVWVKADLTKAGTPAVEEVKMDYGIKGVPTVILIDSSGEEKDRIIGFMGPDEFVKHLRKIR